MAQSFREWLAAVDLILNSKIGMGVRDLPDQRYRDWFEDEMSPQEAVSEVIHDIGPEYGIDPSILGTKKRKASDYRFDFAGAEDIAAISSHLWMDEENWRPTLDMWGGAIGGHPGLYVLAIDAAVALQGVVKKKKIRWETDRNADWMATIPNYVSNIYFYVLRHAKEWPGVKDLERIAAESIVRG